MTRAAIRGKIARKFAAWQLSEQIPQEIALARILSEC